MVKKTFEPPASKPESDAPRAQPLQFWWIGLILIIIFAAFPFIEWDESGNPDISQERKRKLEKELKELENAEQYALVAEANGWYACHSCPNNKQVYLYAGEVWKYGVTRKGKAGRYGAKLAALNLFYFPQFNGSLADCLREEKKKIYYYPILPENLKRKKPLFRPPGNKRDD